MKIVIVGLGLIGGSFAKALSQYTQNEIIGIDKNPRTLSLALDEKSIQYIGKEHDLLDADIVILAMTPQNIIHYVETYSQYFNRQGLVVDVCGVKRDIMNCFKKHFFEKGPQYIGMHPMAGRELFGYEHSLVDMFQGASLVITKDPEVSYRLDEETLKELIYKLGFRNIVPSTPEIHDEVIAYTSQLAHIVSSAYIKSPSMMREVGYSAGSFRDLTRVARLDEKMWTDLFLRNADNLVLEIDEVIKHLNEYKTVLQNRDESTLEELLKDGREKKEWSNNQQRQKK